MTDNLPAAYCFFKELTPRPPMDAVFDRDYLLYAAHGALRVTVGKQNWLLPPSFAAWVPVNTNVLIEIGKPATTCSVLTRPQFCTTLPRHPLVFQVSSMARLMIHYCKDWGLESEQPPEAEGFFLTLLNVCADLSTKSVDVRRPYATDPAIDRAIKFTEDNLMNKISAADVAHSANLSERNMQRRFAQNVGMTWSQVLTRLRMIRALELFSQEDLSVIQVAGECGFNSLSAFNRAFMEFAGKTPTEFRKGLRG